MPWLTSLGYLVFQASRRRAANLRWSVARLGRDEAAATSLEYGMLAAIITAAIIVSLRAMGGQMRSMFSIIAEGMKG